MRLSTLVKNLQGELLYKGNNWEREVEFLCHDTQTNCKGGLFFCLSGGARDGHAYAEQAVKKGAVALVVEKQLNLPVPQFLVEDTRKALSLAAAIYYGSPAEHLKIIGVTGTNGKTSVSTLRADLLRKCGEKTGLIGTVSCSDGETVTASSYTTPPPAMLYPMLAEMQKNGVTTVIMEASSHALAQERLFGLPFDLAIFTNLTRDHLDYHGTREAYLAAKAKLFTAARRSLINADDSAAKEIAFHTAGDVYYCSAKDIDAEFIIEHPLCTEDGITLSLRAMDENITVQAPLFGAFNVYNLSQAAAAAYLLGISKTDIERASTSLRAPLGRLEKLPNTGDISVFIDCFIWWIVWRNTNY